MKNVLLFVALMSLALTGQAAEKSEKCLAAANEYWQAGMETNKGYTNARADKQMAAGNRVTEECGFEVAIEVNKGFTTNKKPSWLVPPKTTGSSFRQSSSIYSQQCREAAARKWLLDYTMSHGNPSPDEVKKSLSVIPGVTAQVTKLCGNKALNNEIRMAANNKVKPTWCAAEISALLK